MKSKQIILFSLLIFLFSGIFSCSLSNEFTYTTDFSDEVKSLVKFDENKNSESLKVTAWNVETFFDCETSGTEYSEFLKSSKWNKEMYENRLKRLVEVLKTVNSDVYVMEEIENENVLKDINNFLAGEWNFKKRYKYACFAKEAGSSIGCTVLSRYPLKNMSVHSLDFSQIQGETPSMRPLLQVSVEKNGKELVLLVNHWKSMSGGEEVTEKWRVAQEILLSERMQILENQKKAFLALGDFNRDILKFKSGDFCEGGQKILLRGGQNFKFSEEFVEVLSPWFEEENLLKEPGSYSFNGEWSRIDNMFFGGTSGYNNFTVETDGNWFDEENNKPFAFSVWNGRGYSDHLPISAVAVF